MFCHLDILAETSQFAHKSPLPSPLTPEKNRIMNDFIFEGNIHLAFANLGM